MITNLYSLLYYPQNIYIPKLPNPPMNKKALFGKIMIILLIIVFIAGYLAIDYALDRIENTDYKKEAGSILGKVIQSLSFENPPPEKTAKIANWNLQIFGQAKAENQNLMQLYALTIKNYDIVFIQEIRDKDGEAFEELCGMLEGYNCKVSSRAGRSSSKEQYGVIYNNTIQIKESKDFNPDEEDRWERPPIKITFNIEGYELTTYNLHAKPSDVPAELDYLEKLIEDKNNIIILGDLNADCTYYDNSAQDDFDSWHWVIKDNEDTTVGKSDCAYDRIIFNDNAYEEYYQHGIYTQAINQEVSDHYLVWTEIDVSN